MKQFYLIVILILLSVQMKSQTFQTGMKVSSHISYTGLYLNLTPTFQAGNFEIAAGPKIALSETRIPTRGPVGLDASLTYFTKCDCRIKGFVTGNYQYIAFSPPYQFEDEGRIRVHEAQIGFGMHWQATGRLRIFSAIYAGRYTERWPGFYGNTSVWQSGYNSMIRVGIGYQFLKG